MPLSWIDENITSSKNNYNLQPKEIIIKEMEPHKVTLMIKKVNLMLYQEKKNIHSHSEAAISSISIERT